MAKKDSNSSNDESNETNSTEENNQSMSEEEKEKLLQQLKDINKKTQNNKPPRQRLVMIEFAGRFHPNGLINTAMYFMVNLVVIYLLVEWFGSVGFSGVLIDLLFFVGLYTVVELIFRNYVTFYHFNVVMKSFGFIFFFGYLTLFYLLEQYIFLSLLRFETETMFIVFIATFIITRYIISHVIRNIILRALR